MNKQTRKFYTRYRLHTSIVPAYVTGLLVFVSGWFTFHPGSGQFEKHIEIVVGLLFVLSCAFGYEVCSRLGFRQFRLKGFKAKSNQNHLKRIETVFDDASKSARGLHPILVEPGDVPMLMVGGDSPGQLWISTHTLMNTSTVDLQHLLAHERAHLKCDTMLDRIFVTGGYWLVCGLGVMILVIQPVLCAMWLLVASGVFLRVNAARLARLEQRADKLAVEATTLSGYVCAMAKHLEQFETGGTTELVRGRLKRMGLTTKQSDALLVPIADDADDMC